MQRKGIYVFDNRIIAAIRRYELPVFFMILGLIILSHWIYLLAIEAMNGQSLSWQQSALIAFSNWMLYVPLFLIGRIVMDGQTGDPTGRLKTLVLVLGTGLVVIYCWQAIIVLEIVPSGHSFAQIFGAKLRSDAIQGLISVGLLFGFLYAARLRTTDSPTPTIQVKDGSTILQIPGKDILYLQAEDYYVRLHTSGKSFLVRRPLYELLETLSDFGFIKVNRSTVVSLCYIRALSTDRKGNLFAVMKNGHCLKVGKSFRKALRQAWSVEE